MKLLMLGFDGLDPFMITKLPTFRQFREKLHLLRSVPSTLTQEAWGAMYTGRPPSEINVVALPRDPDRVSTLKGIGAETIFEALGKAKLKIGCIGMPMTFPVKKIDAFMVAGFPLPAPQYRDDDEYFHPLTIKEIIDSTYYAYLWANEQSPTSKENVTYKAIEQSIKREKKKLECVIQIIDKLDCFDLDFLAIGFSFTDIAAHCRKVYPIYKTYLAADEVLRKIQETFEFDNLLIVSDHGLAMKSWQKKVFRRYRGAAHRRYGTCICVGKDIEDALDSIRVRRRFKFIRKILKLSQADISQFFRKLKRAWKFRDYHELYTPKNSIDITDTYALIAYVFGLPFISRLKKQENEYSEDELQSIKNQLEFLGYI